MNNYQVSAYYFPNYHEDERNRVWHGAGWTEWDLMKQAVPRFPGHQQPKIPLWGYENEADPDVMAKKISAAAEYGIDNFIFDWYWYEDGPYLQRCLEEGFLKAPNCDKLHFALMWANHDWVDIHPAQRSSGKHETVLARGKVSAEAFDRAVDYIISHYFRHPSYFRLDGGLYFSIYMMAGFVSGFGTVAAAREALLRFRRKVRDAGLGELHLNAVVWGQQILPGEFAPSDKNWLVTNLGFDSVTTYVWIHEHWPEGFPVCDYDKYRELCICDYQKLSDYFSVPYYPNVTMGWDTSPRTIPSDRYENLGYPFSPVLTGNTPEEFEQSLQCVKKYLDSTDLKTKMFTINAWNEWTEGSYLEPDTVHKFGYLQAIKNVFCQKNCREDQK